MYNRYVPRPDGSYQRNRMQDTAPQKPPAPPKPPTPEPPQPHPAPAEKPEGIGNFLRQLLPKNFDTADLIIVLLILLMAGDNAENRNNALLTMALYFLM